MLKIGWTVHYTSRDVARPEAVSPWLRDLPDDAASWLSPRFEYDDVLNSYFHRVALIDAPRNSNANRARALACFLNFLHGAGWKVVA